MPVFGAYSHYYDLLYRDKDYVGEADYVRGLICRHCPGARSILDLGCGTGRHALLLSQHGYTVTGVDRSAEMLAQARQQAATGEVSVPRSEPASPPEFVEGDIRSICLGRTFDAVVSLFHVISYQTANDDLVAAFGTVRDHLAPGGLFVFDCWYGPAVLTDPPAVRVKRLEDEAIAVTRIAEPVMHANRNLVEVNFQVLIRDKPTGRVEELKETHQMRYLFRPEIDLLLQAAGMSVVEEMEWLTGRPLDCTTWGGCFVARKA